MTLDELRALAEPGPEGFHYFPDPYRQMAPTLEECELLYALVRAIKPMAVHELGTGYGVSTKFILQGLIDNARGEMFSVEPDDELREQARELLKPTGGACMVIAPDEPRVGIAPDLVFLDSGWQWRERDIVDYLGGVRTSAALVVLHDANRNYELHGASGVLLPTLSGIWLGSAA